MLCGPLHRIHRFVQHLLAVPARKRSWGDLDSSWDVALATSKRILPDAESDQR